MSKRRQRVFNRVLQIMNSRKPDFIVGTEAEPYMKRWRLTPRFLMPLCAIYAHEFCKSDDDVPHDHPYLVNASWILHIGYIEHRFDRVPKGVLPDYKQDLAHEYVPEGAWRWRWGWTAHRIELRTFKLKDLATGQLVERTPHPITLFFCGPRVREWGFHCPQGWRPWRQYVAPTSYGNRVGKGCGE